MVVGWYVDALWIAGLAARWTRAAQTPTRDFDSALAAPMTQIGAGERMIDFWELYGCPTVVGHVSHPNESTRWTQTESG